MNFVFDLDGTICFDGQTIDPELTNFLEAEINAKEEHQLLFASARPVRDILPVLPESLYDCYLIGGNGAMTYFQRQLVQSTPLLKQDVPIIIDYIKEHDLDYMIDETWHYSFKGQTLANLKAKVDVLGKAKNLTITEIQQPLKVLISNYKDQEKVIEALKELTVDFIPYPQESCLDLTRRGINKASTLVSLLGKRPYIAFGNDHNDLELLAQADYSVCVGANEAVCNVANKSIIGETTQIIKAVEEWL